MEPRGVLSLSYLCPRLSASFSSSSSSSFSPLPLVVQEENSVRTLWCMQAGEFSFSSLLPIFLLYRCRTRWRGCSSDFFHHFSGCGSARVGRLEAAMTFHWFLSGLGCSCWFILVIAVIGFRTLEGTFFFHLQHSRHCRFNKVLCRDLDSFWWPECCFASFLSSVWLFFFLSFLSDALSPTGKKEEVLGSPKKPQKTLTISMGYQTKAKGAFWFQALEFLMEYLGHFKGIRTNTSKFPFRLFEWFFPLEPRQLES